MKNFDYYKSIYKNSISNPDKYWKQQAQTHISWEKLGENINSSNFNTGTINWFNDSKLNACYNCIDRHLATMKNKIAIIWSSSKNETKYFSYQHLHQQICKFSNALLTQGIKSGDKVCIYLPMCPEIIIAMLACARIGAIHSVVFAGFSADALALRINDLECKLIVTADSFYRGDKEIKLKQNVDMAIKTCTTIEKIVVLKHSGCDINWNNKTNLWFDKLMNEAEQTHDAESFNAEHPLFVLYTSGSTGTPKGILHTTGGYLLYVTSTFKTVFQPQDDDTYWCTADCGWITGHSYLVYGPLASGATIFMYEDAPNYPNHDTIWQLVDKFKITILYTAPTLIRSLMSYAESNLNTSTRNSLRILGSVGEPINPEAWNWYYEKVGFSKSEVIDTWWQTETGGILISPIPGITKTKPGSATLPLPGIEPEVIDGKLVIKQSWPGQARGIYNAKARFMNAYFKPVKGYYFTGDGATIDEDGYYWITGRLDDVINVSGHRLGTAEIENAIVLHDAVAEAAVIGSSHPIKGQCIVAFAKLMQNQEISDNLKTEIIQCIVDKIGKMATPEEINFVEELPKTRSGKIMRRLLKKIAAKETDDLGDTSTLADADVIGKITSNIPK